MEYFSGEIITTEDGSKSLKHHLLQDTYHSTSGALQESQYIYIDLGLTIVNAPRVTIFEMGLGTGLNLLLTIDFCLKNKIEIDYYTTELYPLSLETIENMGFKEFCSEECYNIFIEAHRADWNSDLPIKLHEFFSITKFKTDITTFNGFPSEINLVYYDAFSPDTQPQLWSKDIFTKLYNNMSENSILMTYSSKGDVKRALRDSGFEVKRLKGPGNKRHIVRAMK